MKWDSNFKKYVSRIREKEPLNPYNFYVFLLYQKITDKFLNTLVSDKERKFKAKVLKTDLWDFVVERDRNILSYIKDNYQNIEIFGIDISDQIVKGAKKIAKDAMVKILKGDITSLSFPDNYFDCILDYSTIDHIRKTKLNCVFNEYYRTLKPGGKALIIFWQKTNWLVFLSRVYNIVSGKVIIDNKNPNNFQYYFQRENIFQIAYQTGFIVKESKYFIGLFLNLFRGPFRKLYRLIPKKFFALSSSIETSQLLNFLFKYFSALCAIEIIKPYKEEKIIEFWDKKIKKGDELSGVLWNKNQLWNRFIDFEQKFLLRKYFNHIKQDHFILDFGCGTGRFFKNFTKKSAHIYGIDTSKNAIKNCYRNFKSNNIKLYLGEIEKIKFNKEMFDYIFSITSLQSINQIEKLKTILRKFKKIIKKEGQIILLESITEKRGDPLVLNIKERDFYKIIEKIGFKILSIRKIDNPVLRKLYLKIDSQKYLNIIKYPLLFIIFIIEITFLGIPFRQNAWYKLVVLEKVK